MLFPSGQYRQISVIEKHQTALAALDLLLSNKPVFLRRSTRQILIIANDGGPTIIRDDEDLAGATAEKYRFIREQQIERRERGLMFLDDGNLPVLPTWEEQIQQLPEVTETAVSVTSGNC